MQLTERQQKVVDKLNELEIPFDIHFHPPIPTIEEALNYWKEFDSTHCKNLFFRNHKGNRHYLVIFDCMKQLAIHELEQRLKQGKLSFASEARMDKYLGLKPGSVSPFGLINDTENHVHLFLDDCLQHAETLSFHPNDCRGTVVIDNAAFMKYLSIVGNTYEFMDM